jgi:serine/threonine protein kinase
MSRLAASRSTPMPSTSVRQRVPPFASSLVNPDNFGSAGSVGCILAEMLNGKPLFPGRDCPSFEFPISLGMIHHTLIRSRPSTTRPPPAHPDPRHPRHAVAARLLRDRLATESRLPARAALPAEEAVPVFVPEREPARDRLAREVLDLQPGQAHQRCRCAQSP